MSATKLARPGNPLDVACTGNLCLTGSWPGQMRAVFRDHKRFVETCFSTYKNRYFSGDGCLRDEDGYSCAGSKHS